MSMIRRQPNTAVFSTEEEMDAFLTENVNPGSTVIINVDNGQWRASWCPGTDIGKYFPNGARSDSQIYFYNRERLWLEIPAFG